MHWTARRLSSALTTWRHRCLTGGSAKAPASSAAAPARPKRPRIPAVLLKFVIAVSSVFLVLYLVVHMIGNLQIFWGQTSINEYAIWLRTLLQPVLGWEGFVWVSASCWRSR